MSTDLYKKLQLSNDNEFLGFVKHIKPHHVDSISKKLIDDRLAMLGYQIEFGCCGTNSFKKLHRREI